MLPYHGAETHYLRHANSFPDRIHRCVQTVSSFKMTSKRKYTEISGKRETSNGSSDKRLGLQQRQVEHLLEQGKKALFRSLKVARGFERQKLGRRQKTAKAEKAEDDLIRFSAEVAVLKVCC